MATTTAKLTATVIPVLKYDDAKKAVKWLCEAFGFKEHAVHAGEDGTVAHAELTFDGGMIMLGSSGSTEFDKIVKTPKNFGGAGTQSIYVVVQDADAHYARAKKAGARILIDLETKPWGGRDYTCADLEGHVWSFGTYNPWAAR